MNMKHTPLIIAAVLAAAVASPGAWAQGRGAGAVPPPSTVVKNQSPIDLHLLAVRIPRAEESKLANNIPVFLVADHRSPLVTVSVSVRGGTLFDPVGKPGVAELVANTVDEGAGGRDAEAIAVLLDKRGASLGASAGAERTTVTLTCLAENLPELMPLLSDVVRHPTFPRDRVARVRARAAEGATARQSDPNALASDALRAALYGAQSPYGEAPATAAQVSAITPADLAMFHGKHFRPEGAIIGVAGDVSSVAVLVLLRGGFGDWVTAGGAGVPDTLPAARLVTAAASPAPVIIDRPGSAQTVLVFGVPGIARTDPDYFPMLVANRIFGGGFNSRLNQKLREEKGYTYGARSTLSAPKWTGTWEASASVRTPVTADAARDFVHEFERMLTTPPKTGELDLVKQSLIGGFALTLESPEAVLARNIERYDLGLPVDYWDTYAGHVAAVTPADVQRVSRHYFSVGTGTPTQTPRVWAVAVGEKGAIASGVTAAVK